MNFTITTIAVSLANYLQAYLPGVQFLEDPAQQKTQTPAIFLQQRYSSIERQVGMIESDKVPSRSKITAFFILFSYPNLNPCSS